jgi:tetratricopeptide (TPR) repeat protein
MPEADESISRNRISGIEKIRKAAGAASVNQKYIIVILSLIAVIALSAVLFLWIYKDRASGGLMQNQGQGVGIVTGNEVMPGSGSQAMRDYQTTNQTLKKAIESYKSGFLANAITEFTEVVESNAADRDKAIALLYLGIIADTKADFAGAIRYFERALGYDKNNPEIYLSMARTYSKMNDFENAAKYALMASELSPADIYPLLLLGNTNFNLTRYDDAIRYYERGLKINPNHPALLYNMAMAMFKKGERFQALEYLKKAADSDGIGEIAYKSYSRLGAEFLESNMFDLAEKYLVQAAKLRPAEALAHYNLGVAYLRQGKNDEALKQFEEAERLGQDDTEILENLGESYFSLKDYDRSLRSYGKVLEKKGRDVKILSRMGEIYYSKGDLDRAYEAYRKVTQVQPATENARIAYLNMGNILDDAQRFDDAIKAYESANAIRDNDDLAYFNLGLAYMHSDKPALAVNAWKKAAEINPGNIKARMMLGDYYLQRGYPDLAEKEFQEIAYKWPENQEATFKLGTIYHRQKDYEDAKKAYRRVIESDGSSEFARKAYINLAVITSAGRQDENTFKEALSMVQKALQIKPDDPDALMALGMVYARMEMHERAIESYYQSIKASRDSKMIAECYNNMGKSYYAMKQYKRSIEAFGRGVEEDPSNEEIRMNRKSAVQAYENELDR